MLWARYQRLLTTHAPKSLRRLLRVLRMLLLEVPSLLGRVSVDVGAGVGVDVVLVPVLLLPLLAAILRLLPYQRPSRLSLSIRPLPWPPWKWTQTQPSNALNPISPMRCLPVL